MSQNPLLNKLNNDGRTPALKAAETGNVSELERLLNSGVDVNYQNEKKESILSIIINKLRIQQLSKKSKSTSYESMSSMFDYNRMFNALINHNCNFNSPVDKDENTGFMALMLLPDMNTVVSKIFTRIELSKANLYGENASSLCVKQNLTQLFNILKNQPSFDVNYRDKETGNTLMLLAAISQPTVLEQLIKMNKEGAKLQDTNLRNENALIIATKSGCIEAVKILLKYKIDVDHQDLLGNTALHYAVELNDSYVTALLIGKKANPSIRNNEGKSALDLAKKLGNTEVLQAIDHPSAYEKKPRNTNLKVNLKVKQHPEIFQYLVPHTTVDYGHKDITTILRQDTRHFSTTFQGNRDVSENFDCCSGSNSFYCINECFNSLCTCFCYCLCCGCFGLFDVHH